MNKVDFNTLRDQLHTRAEDVLTQKRAAYASEHDVLGNFKQLARETGLSEIKVWEVLMRKALNAMIRTANGEDLGGEPGMERFVDFANYVDLGWALANQHSTHSTPLTAKDIHTWGEFLPQVDTPVGTFTPKEIMRVKLRDTLYDTIKAKAANRVVD